MDTSYFAGYKGERGISIALVTPKWFNGPSYPALNPSWDILSEYKRTGDQELYRRRYWNEILAHLDPWQVYRDLHDKVLLCYEKRGVFCHRHIVRDWLWVTAGIVVYEL